MPGPLSVTVTRKRVAWLAGGGVPSVDTTSTVTTTSGRMPASSHASNALSTASFTQVSNAFRGLSKPSRWRFFVKNSETEISRCRAPISTAVTCTGWLAERLALGAATGLLRDLDDEDGGGDGFVAIDPLRCESPRPSMVPRGRCILHRMGERGKRWEDCGEQRA